jgi:hypothetical protein
LGYFDKKEPPMKRFLDTLTIIMTLLLALIATVGIAGLVFIVAQADNTPPGSPVCETFEDGSVVCRWDGDNR